MAIGGASNLPPSDIPPRDSGQAGPVDAALTPPAVHPLAPLAEGFFCPDCGYDLRGSTSPRCPECGCDLAPVRAAQSQIPWVHRRTIGRVRAYLRTAWLVTVHPKRFCAEVARPVSYADARSFRWTSVGLAYFAILLLKLAHGFLQPDSFRDIRELPWLAAPTEVGTLLTLAAWTGLPTYFFHPRRAPLALQNRGVALSLYACAPLVLLVVALPAVVLGLGTFLLIHAGTAWYDKPWIGERRFVLWFSLFFSACALFGWWWNLERIARRVLRRTLRTLAVAILTPVLWFVTGFAIQLGLPALAFYVVLVFYSLR